jgi:hypothetical protein
MAAPLTRMSPASPFLVPDPPLLPPEAVVLELPGLESLPTHWYLPLMTLEEPCSPSKTLQELLMSSVDWMLKAPRLSLRAGSETLCTDQHDVKTGNVNLGGTYEVKLPYKSVAPLTVARAGKVTSERMVLF